MKNKPFLDTNVLLYAIKKDDPRADIAEKLLVRGAVIGVQVLNELVNVCLRKLKMPWAEVLSALRAIRLLCPDPVPVTIEIYETGLRLAQRYGYPIFDALLIGAAQQAACTIFYSEGLHDGQVIEGVTIRNPFRTNLIH